MPRAAEQGFSLVELLVAMAVFSLAVLAILNLTGESARVAVALEERTLASVVAENRAVEALVAVDPPALGVSRGDEEQGGRVWRWTQDVSPTAEPGMLRIVVRVAASADDRTVGEVTVFRGRG